MKQDMRAAADFDRAYPDFQWLYSYTTQLGTHLPDIFPEPLNEARAEALATMLATANFEGAYMLGGYVFMSMVQREYEKLERYEECAAIRQALNLHFAIIEPVHELVRARYKEGPT